MLKKLLTYAPRNLKRDIFTHTSTRRPKCYSKHASRIDLTPVLLVFEISAPRGFGEQWAQGHLKELAPELIKPTKKLEENYSGEYDFLYQLPNKKMIKIEVKASRAVDFISQEPLYVKALAWGSKNPFDMNFQQVKPKCCDVFIWIGVWRDTIKYWVLSSKEVEKNKYYSKGQHRGKRKHWRGTTSFEA